MVSSNQTIVLFKFMLDSGTEVKRAYTEESIKEIPDEPPEWVKNIRRVNGKVVSETGERLSPDIVTATIDEGHEKDAYALLGLAMPIPPVYDAFGNKITRNKMVVYWGSQIRRGTVTAVHWVGEESFCIVDSKYSILSKEVALLDG